MPGGRLAAPPALPRRRVSVALQATGRQAPRRTHRRVAGDGAPRVGWRPLGPWTPGARGGGRVRGGAGPGAQREHLRAAGVAASRALIRAPRPRPADKTELPGASEAPPSPLRLPLHLKEIPRAVGLKRGLPKPERVH